MIKSTELPVKRREYEKRLLNIARNTIMCSAVKYVALAYAFAEVVNGAFSEVTLSCCLLAAGANGIEKMLNADQSPL